MNTNRIIISALLAFPLLGYAQQKTDFIIDIKINPTPVSTKAYLHYEHNGQQILDSAIVTDGHFQFKGLAPEPVQAQLLLDHTGEGLKTTLARQKSDVLDFYIESGKMTLVGQDSVKTAKMSSPTEINAQYQDYQQQSAAFNEAMKMLNTDFAAVSEEKRKDKSFRAGLDARAKAANEEKNILLGKYISGHPNGYFSLQALTDLGGDEPNIAQTEPLFNKLSVSLRNSKEGKDFANRLQAAKVVAVGKIAPGFSQNDVNGNPVTLSGFRGNYVLLDFWASWCAPCRKENPNLLKAYHTYKDKNFRVLGVSLDGEGKKAEWLAAIKADGLEWTQVSDLRSFDNAAAKQYGVNAIPQNFLIDPDGKIVAKNLVGGELNRKLAEIFGSAKNTK